MMYKIKPHQLMPAILLLLILSCPDDDYSSETEALPTPTLLPNTDHLPLAEVENLKAALSDGNIVLSWKDPVSPGFSKVKITCTAYSSNSVIVDKGVEEYEFTHLYGCTEYLFTVKTLDINWNESTGIDLSQIPQVDGILICHVIASPSDAEELSLINCYNYQYDISHWIIGDKNDPNAYTVPADTILNPCEIKKYPRSTLGFGINDSGEIIYLKDSSGTLRDTWYN